MALWEFRLRYYFDWLLLIFINFINCCFIFYRSLLNLLHFWLQLIGLRNRTVLSFVIKINYKLSFLFFFIKFWLWERELLLLLLLLMLLLIIMIRLLLLWRDLLWYLLLYLIFLLNLLFILVCKSINSLRLRFMINYICFRSFMRH